MSTGAPRERAHEVTSPYTEPFLCVLLLTSGAFVTQLLWEWDSGLASGALAAQIAVGLQACSLLDGQLCHWWWQ